MGYQSRGTLAIGVCMADADQRARGLRRRVLASGILGAVCVAMLMVAHFACGPAGGSNAGWNIRVVLMALSLGFLMYGSYSGLIHLFSRTYRSWGLFAGFILNVIGILVSSLVFGLLND